MFRSVLCAIACWTASSACAGELIYNPSNGHYYEFVAVKNITWKAAKDAAGGRCVVDCCGRHHRGYLATVTSQKEQDLLEKHFSSHELVWLGGSDSAVEGEWRWVTGPEANHDCGKGLLFWHGNQHASPIANRFQNWIPGVEPNNVHGGPGEDFLNWNHDNGSTSRGQWNDLSNDNEHDTVSGYFVEYGGLCCCCSCCRR